MKSIRNIRSTRSGLCQFLLRHTHVANRYRPYRDSTQNLRTTFLKVIKRAGLKPWPKLFQNVRSTRETELADQFPLHAVTAWMGNSQIVASKHYLQLRDEHFDRASSEVVALLRVISQATLIQNGFGGTLGGT